MRIPRTIKISCPYCGHFIQLDVYDTDCAEQFVTCGPPGGCDRLFTVNVDLKPTVTIYKLVPVDLEYR